MAPMFEYEVKTQNGEKIDGTLEAENESMLASNLRKKGYYILNIKRKREGFDLSNISLFEKKVKLNDLAVFARQFSAMINSGISIIDALDILRDQIDHPKLQETIIAVTEDIETGSDLSESLAKHPDVFPELFVQMVKAGETGGIIGDVLDKIANHYEKQDELQGKIKSALYYPVTIMVIAILVVLFLLTNVVPTFVSMFSDLGAELPLPTRILIGTSSFLQSYWWLVGLILVALYFAFRNYRKTPEGKLRTDRLILKIPQVGTMMQKIYLSRFSSTLAVLLSSGVDLLASLTIVEDVVGNKLYQKALTEARIKVREGSTLSAPLEKREEFPKLLVHMIKVGEETGGMSSMLEKVSMFYDREVDRSVEGVVSIIEPVIIVFLAVVVGFVVISIVMPMFDMYTYM
ncbi:MAG: type II secretion system F family protein [Halanaerobiales bacterium]|nr:type II secretion system F family protein [Halanaerobiales bacterium]